MKRNVGTCDAFIRMTLGLIGLAWAISRMSRNPWRRMPCFISLLSAMKISEAIFRFCPVLSLLGVDTLNDEEQKRKAPYPTVHFARRKVPPQTSNEEGGQHMNNAPMLELIGDYGFVWIAIIGAVAVVVYSWAKYANKSGGRYK